ncbi:hypothetical protein Glove_535g1 [Diversispora epigaea]|uniref:Uncharacterized protein n=1 Tax=Diversispora epigaea TaxID=1348612 RepID=A0A397GGP4_9GLOM|nr:hypothetical protein Glove_535g1 [Diversispora epigaea]
MIRNCGRLRYDNRAYRKNPNHEPNARESKSFRNSFSHPLESTGIKFLGLLMLMISRKSEECKKNEKCKNSEKCECNKLEEIWFPGVDDKISNESLRWMIRRILCTGGLESLEEESLELGKKFLDQIEKILFYIINIKITPVFSIKRATTFFLLMGRNRIIPLYRDDKGMLTFDLLHKKGYWENAKKFKNINDIKEHKYRRPDSLTKFFDAMEDILIEGLKRTNSASDAKDVNGMKAKYREQNIKKIKEIYDEIEMDKNNSDDKIDKKNSDDEIDKKGGLKQCPSRDFPLTMANENREFFVYTDQPDEEKK